MADDKATGLKGWIRANRRLAGLFLMAGAIMVVAGYAMKLGLTPAEFLLNVGPMMLVFAVGFHLVADSARERREKRNSQSDER